jgi:hypothetical protein
VFVRSAPTEWKRVITLTHQEAQLLHDVLDIQIEGMEAAKEHTEEDPTFKRVEDFLDSIATYDDDITTLRSIQERLNV